MKFFKRRLYAPGPTPIPERVLRALSNQVIYHRSEDFRNIFLDTIERLKKLFKTRNRILILSSSGTGGMEAAVSNLFSPGDKVLVVVGGKFGERWLEICKTFNIEAVVVDVEWGSAVNSEYIESLVVRNKDIKGILTQICETSTGTLHDIESIACVSRAHGLILIADGITAIGVHDICVDDLGIDVVITGSQKALMCPPGLSVISLSDRAVETIYGKKEGMSYYFDLKKEIESQIKGQTAYTPSVNLVFALREALCMMEEEGFENVFERHKILADCVREGIKSIGLELFSESPANGVTAVRIPERIDGVKFVGLSKRLFGATIAGGQGHLKGKIFRLSHMGYIDIFDVLTELEITEFTLREMGYDRFDVGSSVSAAMNVFSGANANG